jgi:hypothetical protein
LWLDESKPTRNIGSLTEEAPEVDARASSTLSRRRALMMAGETITSAYFTTRWGRRRRRLEVAPRFINPT